MKKKAAVLFIFLTVLSCQFSLPLSSAPDKGGGESGFLDNDELTKALAELDEDVPPAPSTEEVITSKTNVSQGVGTVSPEIEKEDVREDRVVFGGNGSRYRMIRHLPEADVEMMGGDENEEKIPGNWNKDAFTFSGFPDTNIRAKKITFSFGSKTAIQVKLLPKQVYRIRFNSVPPFSVINLDYFLQEPPTSKMLNYMFLKVFVGKYELKRIQVSSKDSWLKTSINVGAVSFLNQNVPVAFEFATNQASGLIFSFIPETE